ncbi:hypothetical protein ASPACDRAFT_14297, partial [Aspergillus aculeatus ATCC 16872]
RVVAILSALILVNLAAALDSTSISVALPVITKDLGGDSISAFWCGTSFLVASTLIQPILCVISDLFGRKLAIVISLVTFTIGSVQCAAALGFTPMLCGRVFQGLGAGGFNVMTEVLLTDLLPLSQRGTWFGVLGASWAIGSACGPVVGGALAQLSSWRWIFWLNLPFIGLALLVMPFLLQLQKPPLTPTSLRSLDYLGACLFLTSLAALLIPLTWGGVVYPWTSWHTLVPLLLGAAGLLAFILWERRLPPSVHAFIPFTIFNNRSTILNYMGAFILGMLLWTLLYYLPLYYEVAHGYSMVMSGVALFPETFTTAPAGIATAFVIARTQHYRWALWTGWTLSTVGLGLLRLLTVTTAVAHWIALNLTVGVGAGVLYPALALAIQSSAPLNHMPIAVTMISTARNLGRTAGVALGGSIFQNRMRYHCRHSGVGALVAQAGVYAQDAAMLSEVFKGMPTDTKGLEKEALKVAYARALADVWVFLCGVAGVGWLSSWFIREFSMERELFTTQPLES